jgi:outer membrane protein OmpA-like peptidoglycan-associated protein
MKFRTCFVRVLCLTCSGTFAAQPAPADDCTKGEAYYNQAQQAESPAQRLSYLQQAIAVCPTFAAWYSAGRAQLELVQSEAAVNAFREARRLAQDDRHAALAIGREGEVYLAQNREAEAAGAVESAITQLKDSPPDWLLTLRRTLDKRTAGKIIPARSLEQTLSTARSFGVTPKVRIRIQFAYDSAELDAQGRRQVTELGKALTQFKSGGYRMLVVGHTDKRGTDDYNQGLSEKRAGAVVSTLSREFPELGGSLKPLGKGKRELLYPGDSEEDHYLNRRVEVQLVQ